MHLELLLGVRRPPSMKSSFICMRRCAENEAASGPLDREESVWV
jgi:hypothetical protein